MSTLSPLVDADLDQVTGGAAISLSGFTFFKINTAQTNQSGANVGLLTFATVQNVGQSANIAQS